MIKVFFDDSVLFSGFYSSTGASRSLLEMVKHSPSLWDTTWGIPLWRSGLQHQQGFGVRNPEPSRRYVGTGSWVKKNIIYGITSQTVIDELENNLYKFNEQINIELLIEEYSILIREKISDIEIEPYKVLIEEKDQHVVAGAILTGCQYLITLDKKHLNNQKIKEKITKIKIVSPKELLNKILISPPRRI